MRRERGQISGHRVPRCPRAFASSQAKAEFAPPCSPAFVFCSPRSCCRCRYWSSGSARRRCCARPTRNSPATHRGAPPPRRCLRSKPKPQGRCWRCCGSNRRPQRQSHRKIPRNCRARGANHQHCTGHAGADRASGCSSAADRAREHRRAEAGGRVAAGGRKARNPGLGKPGTERDGARRSRCARRR